MSRRSLIVGRARWAVGALALTFAAALFIVTSGAQAVVVDMNPGANGSASVTYPTDSNDYYGVALMPGLAGDGKTLIPGIDTPQLSNAGVPTVNSTGTCNDPSLTSDLAYAPGSNPLCYLGGGVMHSNETFALTWDPLRRYWSGTRAYVEQFLRDVADASGSLNDPFALTTQYTDRAGGRAGNSSSYGGGCIDYGNPNNTSNANTTCLFGSSQQTGPGNNYPANSCTPGGTSYAFGGNDRCIVDSDVRGEIQSLITNLQVLDHAKGQNPLFVVLLPPGVQVCLNSSESLCSANSAATAKFCSYHSDFQMPDGTNVRYVVQPWTATTRCDEPDSAPIPQNPPVNQLGELIGQRLVSPISQAQLATVTNPEFAGWSAQSGTEINDNNGCLPLGSGLDTVNLGTSSQNPYHIQREWNNGAAISFDPNTYFGCAPDVLLNPTFVVPSAVDAGDSVVFDGSDTASTLIVPNAKYTWSFGDGTGATGPSVVHTYSKGGTYTVKLTVTDRGGNQATSVQTVSVLGPSGQPPTNPPTTNSGGTGALQVRIQLMPQGLRSVVRSGITVMVRANQAANGLAWVMISRAAARRLHIKAGRGPAVVIGRGTVWQVKDGAVFLHLHLSRTTAAKLKRAKHLALTVRLALTGSGGTHIVTVAAGNY